MTDSEAPRRPRVLIADADPAGRAEGGRACAAAGFDVATAADGAAALAELTRFSPDLVLIDMRCPPGGGLALAGTLRALPAAATLPLLFRGTEDEVAALEGGDVGLFAVASRSSSPAFVATQLRLLLPAGRAYRLACYDELTGLPNREQFKRVLTAALAQAQRSSAPLALLHIGLDRFKRINETLGRAAGDQLLKSVTSRLASGIRRERGGDARTAVGEADCLARIGGDDFALLVPGICGERAAEALAGRVRSLVSAGYVRGRHRLVITPSIGMALSPEHGTSAEELLTAADNALALAKAAGRNCYRLFSSASSVQPLERLQLESDMRAALKKNEFVLHYQPKVDLASWSIVGVEALLRWRHPQRGWVPPGEFLPAAKESGLIGPLGRWVLREACRQLGEWQKRGLGVSVAINVSREELNQPHFAETVLDVVRRSGIDPAGLALEIQESLLMRNSEGTAETLRRLRAAGFGLTVDDFGTGHSSLSFLQEFPVDAVKIGRTFIRNLDEGRDNAAVVAAILAMARELRLKVIAEGVETEEQLEYLRDHRCDQIQGFLYSKPLPAQELEDLVAAAPGNPPQALAG
jgi:diguanylate cyclase (GGDEF)-like protein